MKRAVMRARAHVRAPGATGLTPARAADTFVAALQAAGLIDARTVSLCVRATGGVFTLGGVDSRLHAHPPVYTPLLPSTHECVAACASVRACC